MTGYDVMKAHLGLQEVRDKQQLMNWFQQESHNKDLCIDPAVTSWCACSVNAAERQAGNQGTGLLNAQSFRTYGTAVDNYDDAKQGDIIVFHFPFDSAWQGHVTYFDSWDDVDNKVKCLGGNQSNMVCFADYIQDYITDIRRPPAL